MKLKFERVNVCEDYE